MRQFDVYANTSSATRDAYPFIVDIQSNVIAQISTRIVIPLGRKSAFGSMTMDDLTPVVTYDGEELLLLGSPDRISSYKNPQGPHWLS